VRVSGQSLPRLLMTDRVIGLGLVCLTCVPYVLPRHTFPLPAFYAEWVALVLGLFLVAISLCRELVLTMQKSASAHALALPRVMCAPLVLIAGIALQWASDRIRVPASALLTVDYLLWAALLMVLGGELRLRLSALRVADFMAWGFTAGGLGNACVAFAQKFDSYPVAGFFAALIYPASMGRALGNIAQSNHLAHVLCLGSVSAFFLARRGRMPWAVFWVLHGVLALAAAWSGSRSVVLYALLVCLLGFIADKKRWLWLVVAAVQLGALAVLAVPLIGGDATAGSAPESTWARVSATASDVRWALWRDAWAIANQNPLVGSGAESYRRESVLLTANKGEGELKVPAEHAHNIGLQLVAEYGFPLALIALGVIGRLFCGSLRSHLRQVGDRSALIWLGGVLLIASLHSALEYPLWFAYFLGPVALLLGVLESRCWRVTWPHARTLLLGMVVGALGLAFSLLQDYRVLERVNAWRQAESVDTAALERDLRLASTLSGRSLLEPYAQLVLLTSFKPSPALAPEQWAICQQLIDFMPTPQVLSRCEMVAGLSGHDDEARRWRELRLRAWGAR
jgi:O-antigen ligase